MAFISHFLTFSIFILCVGAAPARRQYATDPGSPVVDLGYAQYQGVGLEAGVNEYLGMRYAAPPLGDLRWRAPVDPRSTPAVQNATAVSTALHTAFSLLKKLSAVDEVDLSSSSALYVLVKVRIPVQVSPKTAFLSMSLHHRMQAPIQSCQCGSTSKAEVTQPIPMQTTMEPTSSSNRAMA